MQFVHRPYVLQDTIAAIATPPGDGGVAIIRISGKNAIATASKVFSKNILNYKSHTLHFGEVRSCSGEKVDEALLVIMRAPHSFTGEDIVEIQCHGGSLVSKHVLEAVIEAGARPANPGEFSFKAFMNGKMDLAQAEAIQALIGAKNEKALKLAEEQLEGALSRKVKGFQKRIVDIAAIFEAWVDFPEEGLEFASIDEVTADLESIVKDLKKLIDTFHQGKMIHEGIGLCLIGSPNVGKSSLMNALLGKDRAIVSSIAGTTRDLIEDDLRLNGMHFKLTDTAGIRQAQESIEEEGIKRSKKALERSDIILFVLDVTTIDAESHALIEEIPHDRTVAVWNKVDLDHKRPLPKLPFQSVVEVSCKTGLGLDALHQAIDRLIWANGTPSKEEVIITNLRHKDALMRGCSFCEKVIEGLKASISPEFISSDMRSSLLELGTIIGSNITEDVLSAVFSKFCIGK